MSFNLTNQYISQSFHNLVQISGSTILVDGLGNFVYDLDTIKTGSFTGSFVGDGSGLSNVGVGSGLLTTASFNSYTGSNASRFAGTASFASTASFTPNALITASVASNIITFTKGDGSTFPITVNTGSGGGSGLLTTASFNSYTGSNTSQFAGTSSFASTASYALNGGVTQIVAGTNVTITNGGSGSVTINAATGSGSGSGTPGGSNREIQFNSGSAFSGSAAFRFIYTSQSLEQGYQTTASGSYSHAEGGETQAIGEGSHAEGRQTTASGDYSHAEGEYTQAIGFVSHAEGANTIAQEQFSHAEGILTQAIGLASHAEGSETQAIGYASHAEGDRTKTGTQNAYYAQSVVSGIVTLSSSYGDVSTEFSADNRLYLYDDPFDNIYTRATFIISQSYYSGSTNTIVELYDTSVTTTTAYVGDINYGIENWTGDQTIPGDYSHAEGYETLAIGSYSHAEGYSTQAIGNYSHAEGDRTQAIGIASHAEGYQTQAIGGYSHAEGDATQAIGDHSHAEGNYAQAIGYASHAEGRQTKTGTQNAYYAQSVVSGSIILSGSYGNVTSSFVADNILYLYDQPFDDYYNKAKFIISQSYYSGSTNTIVELYDTSINTATAYVGDLGQGIYNWTGDQTIPGQYSHAEGEYTLALGDYSHAEGSGTQASGEFSHAEGEYTQAIGSVSHAEGDATQAIGGASHAEGEDTQAIGYASHAEGWYTTASGDYSHAEGLGTIASADFQHVQGLYNITSSVSGAFIVGNGVSNASRSNLIYAHDNVVEISGSLFISGAAQSAGNNNILTYNTTTGLVTYTASAAIGGGGSGTPGGSDTEIQFNSGSAFSGSAAFRFIYTSQSLEQGYQTTASGSYSHAEGDTTQAIGSYSHAEGETTIAIGNASHAEGGQTKTGTQNAYYAQSVVSGSITLSGSYGDVTSEFSTDNRLYLYDAPYNIYTRATFIISQSYYSNPNTIVELYDTGINTTTAYVGDINYGIYNWTGDQTIPGYASHAEGWQTQAIGQYSHAEGYYTLAIGEYSHAEGEYTQAIGNYSHAEGRLTNSKGQYSHAEGRQTTASGSYSHAEGYDTQAIGSYSHAEGGSTQASGSYSHAEGANTQAIGVASHAEGNFTQAKGDQSHAEGLGTTASGSYSHAEGTSTQAIGEYSHAEGASTRAIGAGSHAEGLGTIANGDYQHVQGQYNISSSAQSAFIVGNGTSNASRSNLVFASGSTFQISGSLLLNDILVLAPRTTTPTPSAGMLIVSGSGANQHIYCYLNSTWKQLD
jgi:hypothetical protein